MKILNVQIVLSLFSVFVDIVITENEIVEYSLTIKYVVGYPDGVPKRILSINGRFPGPILRGAKGDTMVVHVTNKIQTKKPTSIHWHGIEQFLTPFQDGVDGVTQCPIPYGATMIYKFTLRQSGTYWYHSHHSSQYTDGCWGILIVENKPKEVYKNEYIEDIILTLNDWHHMPATTLMNWYLSPASKGNLPIPDSVMINGRGIYPCVYAELNRKACSSAKQGYSTFSVKQGKVYRIRVINTSAMANYFFSIDNHMLETIEVDGVDTVRVTPVDIVRISAGMRYSFLVTMNSESRGYSFWIRANTSTEDYKTPNINPNPQTFINYSEAKAILIYEPTKRTLEVSSNEDDNGTVIHVDNNDTTATQGRPESPEVIDWTNLTSILSLINQEQEQKNRPTPNIKSLLRISISKSSEHVTLASALLPSTNRKNPKDSILLNQKLCRPYGRKSLAPAQYSQQVVLNVSFFFDSKGVLRSGFNNISYNIGKVPVIFQILKNNTIPEYVHPIVTPVGTVIQIIINNPNPGGHPFHLHGHTFWVVGGGSGNFNDIRDSTSLYRNGVRRDTTAVPAQSWIAIRYKTDNPGPWLFHCHINCHLHSGLAAVLIEGPELMRSFSSSWISYEALRICAVGNTEINI